MKTLNAHRPQPTTVKKLQAENEELRQRLQEVQETIDAIRSGAVDALVVEEPAGHRIYTLEGADRPYRLFVEEMQQGAATLHMDGTIAWCNRQLANLLQTPQEKLIGASLHDFVSPDSRPVYDNLLWQGRTRSGRGEALLQKSGGALVPVFLTFNALPKDSGFAIGVLVTDLTIQRHHDELTAAHAALRKSEERLEKELAATQQLQKISSRLIQEGDVSQLYDEILDAAMSITRSDMASIQMLDKGQDALRMLAWRGFDPAFGQIFAVNRPETRTSFSAARRTGQRMVVPDVETCEFIVGTSALEDHRKTGIRAVQSTPLFSRDGSILGMISTYWRNPHQPAEHELHLLDVLARQAADLLERKQTEEAVARLAAIVQFSKDAIVGKDMNGIITSWNTAAEQLFGYTAEEAIGEPVTMLIPPDRSDEEIAIFERIRRGESVEHYETVRRRKDGTLFEVSLSISPIRNGRGQIVGASKIARDITERKEAEKALRVAQIQLQEHTRKLEARVAERTADLRASNDQLEAFVYSIAHDLRAPLRWMEGFSALLVEEAGTALSKTGQNYAHRINRSAQYMDDLLKDLMAFSQVTQQPIGLTKVDLETVAQGVVSQLEDQIRETNARVETTGPWPAVLAHGPTLGQVLLNLVSNALKFIAPGVPPFIRLRPEERAAASPGPMEGDDSLSPGWVRVWVEDNGVGIAPEHQEQIFRLFSRLNGEKFSGTGVGLAIVQKGIERMGGRMGVESALGQGSRFWVELRKA